MKIIRLFLSLFNKRGCFLLGVFVGVVLTAIFCVTRYDVHAEESLDSTGVYMGTATSKTYGTDSYYYDGEENYLTIIAGTVEATNADGSFTFNVCIKSGYSIRVERVRPDGSHQTMNSNGGPLYNCTSYAVKFYIFANGDDLYNYFYNNLDPSCALNYEELMGDLSYFNSAIPIPVNAYVSSISENNVSTVIKYDASEISAFSSSICKELQFEYSCDYLYQYLSKSQINRKVCSLSSAANDSDSSLDKNDLLCVKSTCGDFYDAFINSGIGVTADSLYWIFNADSGKFIYSGLVDLENSVSSVPPNYFELYSTDFSLVSMEYHMQFIGVQISIDTFYIDDSGAKVKSDTVIVRRFLYDKANDDYGSTFTRITHDDDGNEVFHSSYNQDANGNLIGSSDALTADNLLDYVKNGFGLLGSDGYLEMTRRLLLGVPDYIWVIIALAMSVSISVVFFKSLRGM